MAKSLRSKRGRKLRAFKRIRYGEKELARLKNMLAKAAEEENASSAVTSNTEDSNPTVMEIDSQKEQKPCVKPPKYPCWLSQFKIKKLAKQDKKRKRKETKRLKKVTKTQLKKNKKKNKA